MIQCQDDGTAATAWKNGIPGFPSPSDGQQTPGLKVGVATGQGKNSWTLDEAVAGRFLHLAFWQGHAFDVFFLAENLSPDESQRAPSALNGRTG